MQREIETKVHVSGSSASWQFPTAIILLLFTKITVKLDGILYTMPPEFDRILYVAALVLLLWGLITCWRQRQSVQVIKDDEGCIVKFDGFKLDLFRTDAGSLGITVELEGKDETDDEDRPSRDIFVDRSLLVTVM